MSTTLTTEARWYRQGASNLMPGSVGYDRAPLVVRYRFHTPSTGATSLSFITAGYGVWGGDYGYNDPGFHFLVTEQSTGYERKVGSDIGTAAEKTWIDGNPFMTGSTAVSLMPDADYYLWIWPKDNRYSRVDIGSAQVTVDGVYGTPSTITAADGTFGGQIAVSLNASTPGAQHSVSVSCAGRTEILLTDSTAVSCVWTPDLASYAALLPNAGSAQATITCVTRYGGNTVGTRTKTITVSFAAGSLPPALAAGWALAAVFNSGSAAGLSVYVQGVSRAEVSFDSSKISCLYGASIAGYRIRCSGSTVSASPYRTGVLTGDTEIICTVTDSRGQEASETLQISVEPYAEPRLTEATVFRCDSTGTPADDGQYYSARGKALFSSLAGQNSVTLSAAHKRTDAASYGTEVTLQNDTASVIGSISADYSYLVRLTVRDALGNEAAVTAALATQRWAMKFRPNGRGVGFGKAPEHDNCIELPSGWVIRIGNTVVLSE